MALFEIFKNNVLSIIESTPFSTSSIETKKFELILEKEYMQKMVDATINVIQGIPLSKIVNSTIVRTMSSDLFELLLSRPIDSKVEKLTKIITTQCNMPDQLKEDMRALKENTQKLLAERR